MEWNKVSEVELPFGKEVIAFNKEWINSDFNPNGRADSWVPSSIDVFAEDWEIVE